MKRPLFNLLIALGAIGLLEMTPERSAADPPEVVAGACADGCCHKVCRPTVDTRIVPKRVYNDVCEDFCLPGCRLFAHFGRKQCCPDQPPCLEPGPSAPPPPPKKMVQTPHLLEHSLSDK